MARAIRHSGTDLAQVGVIPSWYPYFLAADRLHCTPWEAAGLSWGPWWVQWAIIARSAEIEANKPVDQEPVQSLEELGL